MKRKILHKNLPYVLLRIKMMPQENQLFYNFCSWSQWNWYLFTTWPRLIVGCRSHISHQWLSALHANFYMALWEPLLINTWFLKSHEKASRKYFLPCALWPCLILWMPNFILSNQLLPKFHGCFLNCHLEIRAPTYNHFLLFAFLFFTIWRRKQYTPLTIFCS